MKHRSTRGPRPRRTGRALIALIAAAALATGVVLYDRSADPHGPLPVHLPTRPASYLGVYTTGMPASYSGVTAFARATGSKPDIAMYYSGWYVPFPAGFARQVAANGGVPLIQMDPDNISVEAIAKGQFDGYLSEFAEAVRAYQHPVILSFGHEMNGPWYSWGYGKTSPSTYVSAWRHVVNLFRALGANNVTWLWTVNIVDDTRGGQIPKPGPWWPGSRYVDWVGIDGYYLKPSWQFAPLFGPTIAAVHALTSDPILIAETGAVPATGQAHKITDLFRGIRKYGLLGFVWFDAKNSLGVDFRIDSTGGFAAFRAGARTYTRP
jgi:Glycosyl hydrolase family 26